MTFEEIKPDIFDINRDMPRAPAAPCLPPLERVDSGAVCTRPLFTCPYHISNWPKTRSQGSQRNVLALFHLHDDIYVKTDKLQSPLNVRDLSHCFRREDGRPAVDTSRHPNYAWRVKGSICSITTFRFCRIPAGVVLYLQAPCFSHRIQC